MLLPVDWVRCNNHRASHVELLKQRDHLAHGWDALQSNFPHFGSCKFLLTHMWLVLLSMSTKKHSVYVYGTFLIGRFLSRKFRKHRQVLSLKKKKNLVFLHFGECLTRIRPISDRKPYFYWKTLKIYINKKIEKHLHANLNVSLD